MRKFLLFFILISQTVFSQQYEWLKIKKYKVATLSDSLKENSGLHFFKGKLYTFNDGGNSSEIFEMNPNNGKILKKIDLKVPNTDWEAITADSENLYIGDFGNNWGTRKDLKIYQYNLDSAKIKEINFHYPEQQEYTAKPQNNNWDAESLIFFDGKLHLFTKEWRSYKTTHYTINPNISENQAAEKFETYDLGYIATDASFYNNQLYIIGYTKKMEVYLSVFNKDEKDYFFNLPSKKYYLGSSSSLGQIEGITVDENGIYISGENFNFKIFKAPQSFYFIPKNKFPDSKRNNVK